MAPLVDIRNLYKIYKTGETEVHALDGVSLVITKGEFTAIIGHSGSGKSTLMNILGCLDNPSSGEYILNGEQVARLSENRLSEIRNRQIGFIFQSFNLIPSLSALENVELPLIYRGIPAAERHRIAAQALTRVGLAGRMHHRPSEMSGGQQQRAAIARAIAAKPPVVLADEPTGNLDSKSGSEVISILMELHDEGRTVVLITHDPTVAACANRVVTISDGKICSDAARDGSGPCGRRSVQVDEL